jgi:Catalase
MKNDDRKSTTTDAAIPVASDEHLLTVGPDGPILLQDHYLIEQMANFNRERIAERQPHAKGSGAFGYFEVTKDVRIGTAVFEISEPRIPCWRLGVRMNDQGLCAVLPKRCGPGHTCGSFLRARSALEMRSGSSKDRITISRSETYFEFTLEIEERSSDCSLFLASRRAGVAGRNVFLRKRRSSRGLGSWMLLISNNWARDNGTKSAYELTDCL